MAMLLRMRSLLLSIPKTPSFFTNFRFLPFSAPSIAASPPTTPSAILQFLATECDFSPSQISKIMKANKNLKRVKSTQTARQVVEFLREWGFTDSQLHSTITRCPNVLCLRADTQLKPMFDFLTNLGFPNKDLRNLISRDPRLLGCSLDGNIKPRIIFLEKLFGSKDRLIKGLKRAPPLLITSVEKKLKPKIDILEKWGIEGELLSLLLSVYPSALARIRIEMLEIRVEYVRNTIGLVDCSKQFVYAVGLLMGMGPQNFEKKVKLLEGLGLLKEEVQQLLRKQPLLFLLSTNKMQDNMDFLTHAAGFQPNVLLSNPCLLQLSVEKRLKPRLAVFQALCAKQQPTPNLLRMLSLSEKEFLQKVVECSPHASILKDSYERKVNSTDVEFETT